MPDAKETGERATFAAHGWVGLVLVLVCWPLNWLLPGMRTHVLFFPLWVGFVWTVDALVLLRTETSLLARSRAGFASLFVLSIPVWWLFELLNRRLANWEYVGRERFGPIEYALLCSLSFSTVIPAVFESAELARSFAWVERFERGPRVRLSSRGLALVFVAGALMLAALLLWPRRFYPLVWVSGVFLLEPVAHRLRRRSLTSDLERGDWRPWISLWVGALVCGFFWEMWNWYSDPKWIYHVPGVGFWHVFEMPLLGYLGYLPFALELFLLAQLCLPSRWQARL